MQKQFTYIYCENKYEAEQAQEFYKWDVFYELYSLPCVFASIWFDIVSNKDLIVSYDWNWIDKFLAHYPDFKDITKEVLKQPMPFIKTKQDYRKIFIGDEIYSESHRWSVRVTQISEVNKEIILTWDVLEWWQRIFGITLKEYEVLQGNYRFSSLWGKDE